MGGTIGTAAGYNVGQLIFSHRTDKGVQAEFFANKEEARSCTWNSLEQSPHKYSRLAELEQHRAGDGAFYFTLVYPNDRTPGKTIFQWKQTSNPVTSKPGSPVVGFVSKNPGQLPVDLFGGLWMGNTHATFLQGDARPGGLWFMAVGEHIPFGVGIAGVPEPAVVVDFVQLFVDPAGDADAL